MKKIVAVCLIVLLVFTLCACKTKIQPTPTDSSMPGCVVSPTSTQDVNSMETRAPSWGRGDVIEGDPSEGKGDIIESDPSGGRGDLAEGDPGEVEVPNWWGEFASEDFSIGITNFNGSSFHFSFFLLRDGSTVFEGVAALYSDNDHMAEYMDISFYLYEDSNAIDFFTSDDSEWEHMCGNYQRIE